MHAITKRGLVLAAATSGMILGSAAVAAADPATTADTSNSGRAATGWIAHAPVNAPVKLCGENMQATAIREMLKGSGCVAGAHDAAAAAAADADAAGHGDTGERAQAQGDWGAPVLFCGSPAAFAATVKSIHEGSTCTG